MCIGKQSIIGTVTIIKLETISNVVVVWVKHLRDHSSMGSGKAVASDHGRGEAEEHADPRHGLRRLN